jgi:diacylglycerol kinase family enzyme
MFVAPGERASTKDAKIVRVTLIHNPEAGDDDQPDADALQALVRAAGHEVRYQPCRDETWPAALDEAADVVAVAGGDGTVGRVAKKLIGRKLPVAPLPLGTANNISKTLGLTDLSLEEIVAGWDMAEQRAFDVGVAKGPWGSRYFVEAMGVGLFACTMQVADDSAELASLPEADAKVAYAIRMLRQRLARCTPHTLKLKLDGRDMSGDYVLFEAMNMEFVGPNLYLAPNIAPTDGLLDVVLVTTDERDKLHASLATWQQGELAHPDLTRHRAARVEMEWNGFEVHFDDEPWPSTKQERAALNRIELTLERNALCFLAPSPVQSPP